MSWPDTVAYLAWRMSLNGSGPEAFEVKHIFRKGMYVRQFELPANFLFISRPHLRGHRLQLLDGTAELIFSREKKVTYTAFAQIDTESGFQGVAYTQTPCLVQSCHLNLEECRDVEVLEDKFFGPIEPVLLRGEQVAQRLLT
jgi:hypothetical protein